MIATTTENKIIYRHKIELVTNSDVEEFNRLAVRQKSDVFLVGPNMKINAKSFIGVHLARVSWEDLYMETEFDPYSAFNKFIVE